MLKDIEQLIAQNVPQAQVKLEQREQGDSVLFVDAGQILPVCQTLRSNGQHDFKVLQVITGCDYEDRIEVSYVLATFNPEDDQQVILKVKLPRENPEVESVTSVWKAAFWQERECYDMVGVTFKNHPDFRRILCPDDWEGFPLRRDYQPSHKYLHMVINPEEKMNYPERQFVDRQKQDPQASRPELEWE